MAEIVLAIAQTLFAALQCSELKKIFNAWGCKSELDELSSTVSTIKNVLKDAESMSLSHEARGYIEELKDVVYQADDLFDEIVTHLEQNQLDHESRSKSGRFYKKVRHFFSSDKNQISQAHKMHDKIKKIQANMNATVNNHQKFTLGVDHEPRRKRVEESGFVNVNDIIGRDKDKEAIIEKLLESKDQDVHFMTIVGVGGVGKTALAQLVYNDESIIKEFGDLRFWVCVSDQDKQQFDVKAILCKILRLVTNGQRFFDEYEYELVQLEFQKQLGGKKYLLILDDVWNENRQKWVVLQNILKLDQGGSKVLVTARSEITAATIGNGAIHRLEGLSRHDSWRLFERVTEYKQHHDEVDHLDFKEIGMNIVKKCHNNPLAIQVVGSLLYKQDIIKWKLFESSDLSKIDKDDKTDNDNEIMYVLKLSYHNLDSPLKSCFSYCAVLPKGSEIQKDMLINLWIAQGYIIMSGLPTDNGSQRMANNTAELYFSTLLQRCFFQDVKRDEFGDVESVKIHDLMHDVAQEVAGEGIQVLSPVKDSCGDKVRHLSFKEIIGPISSTSKLRSYIQLCDTSFSWDNTPVDKLKFVRVLVFKYLNHTNMKAVGSIGELLYLRYLDLSNNSFENLPSSSISKLHNLQTLILRRCNKLTELPRDLSKLVNLRHLDISDCDGLTYMPSDMDKLTSLRVLTNFVVGAQNSFKDLETLTNLTGCLSIRIGSHCSTLKPDSSSYLSNMEDLKQVRITFDENCEDQEAVLQKLEPHKNLKRLQLRSYEGEAISWWRTAENYDSIYLNLVHIEIKNCDHLQHMPSFSKLPFLKSLKLIYLPNLEYMEKSNNTLKETLFFPSLKVLEMHGLDKLEGWFSKVKPADADHGFNKRFPCLSQLKIYSCQDLMSFPPCPTVESLCCQKLQILMEVVPRNQTSCLTTLTLDSDDELKSLCEINSVFMNCGSSLQRLTISNCRKLVNISDGLEHLTVLESLELFSNDRLNFKQSDINPWRSSLQNSLRTLKLNSLKGLTNLPIGMQYLTSLQTLSLRGCDKLEAIPQWITWLPLQYLDIHQSHKLQERCSKPNGADWSKVKDIPKIIHL